MKKTLLFSILLLTYFLTNAQSFEETVDIKYESRERILKIDVNRGFERDLNIELYGDDRYLGSYSLLRDKVLIDLMEGVSSYKLVFTHDADRSSDFGIATVLDVDKFDLSSVANLADFFKKSCAREEVLYYLIQNTLFEKQCVCNQFNTVGPGVFFTLYSNGVLANYLIEHGCIAQNYSDTTTYRKSGNDLDIKSIKTVNNQLQIPLQDNHKKNYIIYDMMGKAITGNTCCENIIDLSLFTEGIYLIKLTDLFSNEVFTYKIIK